MPASRSSWEHKAIRLPSGSAVPPAILLIEYGARDWGRGHGRRRQPTVIDGLVGFSSVSKRATTRGHAAATNHSILVEHGSIGVGDPTCRGCSILGGQRARNAPAPVGDKCPSRPRDCHAHGSLLETLWDTLPSTRLASTTSARSRDRCWYLNTSVLPPACTRGNCSGGLKPLVARAERVVTEAPSS